MRTALLLFVLSQSPFLCAQLANGSFEDGQGNFDSSGWISTGSALPGPPATGFGNYGVLVCTSNSAGCNGWSRFYQYVPGIADGGTWTLSGWCGVFTFPFFSPYVGIRTGWKDALGTLHFNTAALTNNGGYTYLSVTNTFTLAPGDTAFVECDPGTAGGMGTNQLFAMFDGLELTDITTDVSDRTEADPLVLRCNLVGDRLWFACGSAVQEVRIIEAGSGRSIHTSFEAQGTTNVVDVVQLSAGPSVLWVRTNAGIRTARFMKL
ncbi:MAG: hypothetical protein ABI599_06925 [Flavobacteriales bacterium]